MSLLIRSQCLRFDSYIDLFSCIIIGCTAIFFSSCSGSYNATLTPGYSFRVFDTVAVSYIDYAEPAVSDSVTNILQQYLFTCANLKFVSAQSFESLLQANGLTIPKRLTREFLLRLRHISAARYLLIGNVTLWKRSYMALTPKKSNVGIVLSLYDLDNGEPVWFVSGESESDFTGLLASSPEFLCRTVIRNMIKEVNGFCN